MDLWKVTYYAPGMVLQTFDSTQGEPEDAPALGVMGISQKAPPDGYEEHIYGYPDYQWLTPKECWVGATPQNIAARSSLGVATSATLHGLPVTNEEWRIACGEIVSDQRFPACGLSREEVTDILSGAAIEGFENLFEAEKIAWLLGYSREQIEALTGTAHKRRVATGG